MWFDVFKVLGQTPLSDAGQLARTPCSLLYVWLHVECRGACSRQRPSDGSTGPWVMQQSQLVRQRHGMELCRQTTSACSRPSSASGFAHPSAAPAAVAGLARARLRWRVRKCLVGVLCRTRGGFRYRSTESGRFEGAFHNMAVFDELTPTHFFLRL
jgi:hypothetical protein